MTNNPSIIADVFHRTGAVEVWGRGKNRVIAMCKNHGAPPPLFEERQGFLIVTFRAQLVVGSVAGTSETKSEDQVGTKLGLSRDQVEVLRLCRQEQPLVAMMNTVGRQNRTKFRNGFVKPLIEAGLLELIIPDKPRSSKQKYWLTEKGRQALHERTGGAK